MYEKDYLCSKDKFCKIATTDIDGILRGKYINKSKLEKSIESNSLGFCSCIYAWDSNDTTYNVECSGEHTGHHDFNGVIDVNSKRYIPWENNIELYLFDFPEQKQCPRNLLRNIERKANKLNLYPIFGMEYEWYNIKRSTFGSTNEPITSGMAGYSILRTSENRLFFNSILENMTRFNIELEALHTETGPGFLEASILPNTALQSADNGILFKNSIKELCHNTDIFPTFMAKPRADLQGCGGHIHQSLTDIKNNNLFYNKDDPNGMSELMKSYIAGQLYCFKYIIPMFAPTINSYKRFISNAWAPTILNWGIDNRCSAFRVINSSPSSMRVECRISGADANPYLAISACLASGLYGILNKMELKIPPINGNGNDGGCNNQVKLPTSLFEATQIMEKSQIAHELFGSEFVTHYVQTRYHECKLYQNAITDWEINRYSEYV